MRFFVVALALASALVPVLDGSAEARRYKREHYDYGDRYERSERGERAERRSSTMDREGRCIRDNGRRMDTLDLNNRCDREEFWERFRDQGGNRR
jgi:hypothetical protein